LFHSFIRVGEKNEPFCSNDSYLAIGVFLLISKAHSPSWPNGLIIIIEKHLPRSVKNCTAPANRLLSCWGLLLVECSPPAPPVTRLSPCAEGSIPPPQPMSYCASAHCRRVRTATCDILQVLRMGIPSSLYNPPIPGVQLPLYKIMHLTFDCKIL
jgi:hypothetical protein